MAELTKTEHNGNSAFSFSFGERFEAGGLMWMSEKDTSHSETFFAIYTNFAKFTFAITMLQSLDIHSFIFSSEQILYPFIDGKG